MNTKITNARHATATVEEQPLHLRLRSRAAATIVAGCLAVSMCPAAAFALPSDTGMQGGGTPAMEQPYQGGSQQDFNQQGGMSQDAPGMPSQFNQQGDQGQAGPQGQMEGSAPEGAPDGQAPDGQMPNGQAPDGQLPSGQPGGAGENAAMPDGAQVPGAPADDAAASQVRDYLMEKFGIAASADMGAEGALPGGQQMGQPGEAPEIPEGEVNVQAIIDTVRDVMRQYGADALQSADFTDETWKTELASFIQKATVERLEMFQRGLAPSGEVAPSEAFANVSDKGMDGIPANDAAGAPEGAPAGDVAGAPEGAPEGAPSDLAQRMETLEGNLLSTLVDFIVSAL